MQPTLAVTAPAGKSEVAGGGLLLTKSVHR